MRCASVDLGLSQPHLLQQERSHNNASLVGYSCASQQRRAARHCASADLHARGSKHREGVLANLAHN